MSVLRRKVVRVAAVRGLGPSAAACSAANCSFTSAGQFAERALICASMDFNVALSPLFAATRASSS